MTMGRQCPWGGYMCDAANQSRCCLCLWLKWRNDITALLEIREQDDTKTQRTNSAKIQRTRRCHNTKNKMELKYKEHDYAKIQRTNSAINTLLCFSIKLTCAITDTQSLAHSSHSLSHRM